MDKKIAIVTFYDEKCGAFALLTDAAKSHYCEKFGYKYFLHKERTVPERRPHWEKPNAMLSHFDDFDYVVWMDADATIVNMDFDIAELFGDKIIYMSKDINGWNNGVFAVKTGDIARNFLEDVNRLYPEFKHAKFIEQTCMGHLMDTKYKEYVCQVPAKKWNCYDNVYKHYIDNEFCNGDFILHLPGEGGLPKTNPPYRIKRFTEINEANGI